MTEKNETKIETATIATDVVIVSNATDVAIPTDVLGLHKYIETGVERLKAIEAVLKTPGMLAPAMYPTMLEHAKRAASHLLQAQKACGERLKALPTNPGTHSPDVPTKKQALNDMNISKTEAWYLEQLDDDLIKRTEARADELRTLPTLLLAKSILQHDKDVEKQKKKQELDEQTFAALYSSNKLVAVPGCQYDVVFADPPYKTAQSEQISKMSTDDMKGINIPCKKDSVLFMFADPDNLSYAMDLMTAWGYKYQSHMVYQTSKTASMSKWVVAGHRLLLIGTKGNYSSPLDKLKLPSVQSQYRIDESNPYADVMDLIEGYCPNGVFLNLFATNVANARWGTFQKTK